MIEREQFRQVCGWNRCLSQEIRSLRAELHRVSRENKRLEATNARLGVEAEATDRLLGTAMDAMVEAA